ncbi:MAG: acyltransferase [Verrucomicrobiota bacterium]
MFLMRLFTRLIAGLLGGDVAARLWGVRVGKNCRIFNTYFGTEPWLIRLGDRVVIASSVQFITHDASTWLIRDQKGRRYYYASIQIGNDVFIGHNAIILPGVHIGNKVIVGAGSVVTKSIPSGVVIAGNPAHIIGSYEDYEKRILSSCPSEENIQGRTRKQCVNSVADTNFISELQSE